MKCGHWLLLSNNYIDKIDAFYKEISYTVENIYYFYFKRSHDSVLYKLFNHSCWNELHSAVIQELHVTGARKEFLIFEWSGRILYILMQDTVLYSPL